MSFEVSSKESSAVNNLISGGKILAGFGISALVAGAVATVFETAPLWVPALVAAGPIGWGILAGGAAIFLALVIFGAYKASRSPKELENQVEVQPDFESKVAVLPEDVRDIVLSFIKDKNMSAEEADKFIEHLNDFSHASTIRYLFKQNAENATAFLESTLKNLRGFVFGTWNAGTSAADYWQLLEVDADTLFDNRPALEAGANRVRAELLAERATDLSGSTDVVALQEVAGKGRADIETFRERGFHIVRFNSKDHTDTAIAINPDKFIGIEDRSFDDFGVDFTVAVAIEKASGKKIAFVSGHIPGFNLEPKDERESRNAHEGAEPGTNNIRGLIRRLDEACSDCDTILIGADVNAILGDQTDVLGTQQKRFELFRNAGYTICRTGAPTSHMERTMRGEMPAKPNRELDYVFIRSKDTHEASLEARGPYSLNPIASPSDHAPVTVSVRPSNV